MRIFLSGKSTHNGFLLMEALVALLLFMSMSMCVGNYWHYLSCTRSLTYARLEGLSKAIAAVDALIINHEQLQSRNYSFEYKYTPVSINTDLDIALPAISLVTVKVVKAESAIALKAFYGE